MQLWKQAFSRRVPHVLVAFIGAIWAITQAVTFAVDRYGVADVWVDRTLVGGLLLVPAVAWFAWRIGAEGSVTWTARDWLYGGANLVLAGIVASFMPTVTTPAETPVADTATVPPPAIPRKSAILIGPVRVATTSTEAEDVAFALPSLIEADLHFEPSFYASSFVSQGPRVMSPALMAKGQTDPRTADNGAWRMAGRQAKADVLVLGKLDHRDGLWQLQLTLTHWLPKESTTTLDVSAADPFLLVDAASARIRGFMADQGTSLTGDDPAIASITNEHWALVSVYAQAVDMLDMKTRPADALVALDRIIAEAPTFALAHWARFRANYALGRIDAVKGDITTLTRMLPQMPENYRFQLQRFDARLRADRTSEREVLRLWAASDPAATEPLFALSEQDYQEKGDEASLARLAELARRSPTVDQLLRVAAKFDLRGEFEQASALRKEAQERAPGESNALVQQAQIDEYLGRFDQAEAAYRKAQVQSPTLKAPISGLTRLRFARGDVDGALSEMERQAVEATNPGSQLSTAIEHASMLHRLGRHREALSILKPVAERQAPTMSPMDRLGRIDGALVGAIARAEGHGAAVTYIETQVLFDDALMRDYAHAHLHWLAAVNANEFDDALVRQPRYEAIVKSVAPDSLESIAAYSPFLVVAAGGAEAATIDAMLAAEAKLPDLVRREKLAWANRDELRKLVLPELIRAGRLEVAKEWLAESLSRLPHDPGLRVMEAMRLHAEGDLEQARGTLEPMAALMAKADASSKLRIEYDALVAALQ